MAEKRTIAQILRVHDRIKSVRRSLHDSQGRFAKRVGLADQTHVSRYERGAQMPRIKLLERIARVGDTTVEWLVTGHDPTAHPMHVSATPAPVGPRARGEPSLPDAVVKAQAQVAAIYFHYKPKSKEWGLLVDMLNRLASEAEPPSEEESREEKRPGRRVTLTPPKGEG